MDKSSTTFGFFSISTVDFKWRISINSLNWLNVANVARFPGMKTLFPTNCKLVSRGTLQFWSKFSSSSKPIPYPTNPQLVSPIFVTVMLFAVTYHHSVRRSSRYFTMLINISIGTTFSVVKKGSPLGELKLSSLVLHWALMLMFLFSSQTIPNHPSVFLMSEIED